MANRDLTPSRRGASLSPFGAADPFNSFRREMDRLFEDFFAPMEPRSFGAAAAAPRTMGLWPTLDVHETEQAYTVTAELPGIDPQQVELNLNDNVLTLRGEKRSERNEEDAGRRYSERSFGRFERTIPFPAEVDPERVEASFRDGLLTITLPKNAQSRDRSRRIEIKPTSGQSSGNGGQGMSGGNGGTQAGYASDPATQAGLGSSGGAQAASGTDGQ